MWLESLVKICIDFFEAITFVFVIQEYEVACTTRLGKYDRTLDTGLHYLMKNLVPVEVVGNSILKTCPITAKIIEIRNVAGKSG